MVENVSESSRHWRYVPHRGGGGLTIGGGGYSGLYFSTPEYAKTLSVHKSTGESLRGGAERDGTAREEWDTDWHSELGSSQLTSPAATEEPSFEIYFHLQYVRYDWISVKDRIVQYYNYAIAVERRPSRRPARRPAGATDGATAVPTAGATAVPTAVPTAVYAVCDYGIRLRLPLRLARCTIRLTIR